MTDKNAITLADIAAILWPEGAHDEDWSADTLEAIAAILERAGHGPEGDGDEGDYGEARILAGMEGGNRGLAEFDGLETDPDDDRWQAAGRFFTSKADRQQWVAASAK